MTEFIINEIGGKAIEGITYAFVRTDARANQSDRDRYQQYKELRNMLDRQGFQKEDIFRMYQVQNGIIFDIDMAIVKKIGTILTNRMLEQDGEQPNPDIIGDRPEKRRKGDMVQLARYLKKCYDAGEYIVDVALFSRNQVPEIVINGKIPTGEYAIQRFKAYAIRQWDLEDVNKNILLPMGLKIKQLAPGMILPTKTGVLFQLQLEAYNIGNSGVQLNKMR